MDLHKRQQELIEKQAILQQAKQTLKREFVGIDGVIEEVVDAMSSWYLFHDIQEKPVIINLWGLTGVGKSSLVNRLVQLIGMEQKYFSFDLGETDNRDWNVQRTLEEIYDNVNGYPVILALDEFQHARTLNDFGEEKEKSPSRVIWQLLDSGKFKVSKFNLHLDELFEFIQRIRFLISNGVVVKNGMVVENQKYFIQKMNLRDVYMVYGEDDKSSFLKTDEVLFVPSRLHATIYNFAKERFSTKIELEEKLLTFDGVETLSFLLEVFDLANSPKTVDCSKGLIFVMGNLDEAYTMSHNFNPDMDADEFHEQSLKITVPHIKKALQKRFRNEQIARLGNLHIIYPAFSKASFQKIIALELAKIEKKLLDNSRQLRELNAFKDRMFNVVAHDIRDPLAVLTNLMELMEEELQSPRDNHQEIVQEMGQQIQNTFTLVESLLDWFRSQKGGMIFRPVALNLSHVVQNNVNLLQIRSARKGIQIHTDIPLGTIVYADKEMLNLILRNLLSNALKFTESGGHIQLKAKLAENKMVVSVEDNGEGIPLEQASSLLKDVNPVSSEGTEGERGFGLGLTLCKEFVRLNGGEIWFDSTPSEGSSFYFSIPTPRKAIPFVSSMKGAV